MRKLLVTGLVVVSLGLSATPAQAVRPVPHSPCAAELKGLHPAQHQHYWASKGWFLDPYWRDADGRSCWVH
jgi:hypothetical protein